MLIGWGRIAPAVSPHVTCGGPETAVDEAVTLPSVPMMLTEYVGELPRNVLKTPNEPVNTTGLLVAVDLGVAPGDDFDFEGLGEGC